MPPTNEKVLSAAQAVLLGRAAVMEGVDGCASRPRPGHHLGVQHPALVAAGMRLDGEHLVLDVLGPWPIPAAVREP